MTAIDDIGLAARLKPHDCPHPASYWSSEDAHELVPERLREVLLDRGYSINRTGEDDFVPLVKWFTPDAGATWLIVSLDPDMPSLAYGLCDLGVGSPELGMVSVTELQGLRGPTGMRVERDLHFKANCRIGEYAERARRAGTIHA